MGMSNAVALSSSSANDRVTFQRKQLRSKGCLLLANNMRGQITWMREMLMQSALALMSRDQYQKYLAAAIGRDEIRVA